MPQYQVEALRTIRSLQAQHERAGHDAQAEQMQRIADQVAGVMQENERLREIISQSTAAIGNGSFCSAQASVEFMAGTPGEISAEVGSLRTERSALKEALSDLLDRYVQAIGNEGIECYNARHTLRISA